MLFFHFRKKKLFPHFIFHFFFRLISQNRIEYWNRTAHLPIISPTVLILQLRHCQYNFIRLKLLPTKLYNFTLLLKVAQWYYYHNIQRLIKRIYRICVKCHGVLSSVSRTIANNYVPFISAKVSWLLLLSTSNETFEETYRNKKKPWATLHDMKPRILYF